MAAFTPDASHERAFRDALGQFATGVTVVTIPGPVGLTANSFAAVSLEPPLVLWSPARRSSRFPAFAAAARFSIHVLAAGQTDICRHFTRNGHFDGIDHQIDTHGVPLIAGCLARFDCRPARQIDAGDHLVILGHVEQVETALGAPLVFHAGHFASLPE